MATSSKRSDQNGGWQCPKCTLHNSNEVDRCLACSTCRSDQHTSSNSTHDEPCGPVKFTKEELSVRSLMKGRAVYWRCPTCRGKFGSSIVRCTLCGFVRTNSYADESEGHGIGGRLKNWLSKVGIEVIDTGAVWRCSVCSAENQEEAMICFTCGSERAAHRRSRHEYIKHTKNSTTAHERRTLERLSSSDQHQQKFAREISLPSEFLREIQDGRDVWTCSECTYENSLACSHCTMCNASKDLAETTLAAINSSLNASTSENSQPTLPEDSSVSRHPVQRQHSLTVQEIRRLDEDKALTIWMTIVDEYKRSGGSFIDPDFPHSGKSLFLFPDCPQDWPVHGWLRPTMIKDIFSLLSQEQWTVYRSPSPSDIAQGQLGNCWFLSALAVIAEIPDLLEQIIVTKQFCSQGVYQLRFCKDGLWKVIIVDDWFPCHYNKQLVFSKARRKQLWVPLIEKGLAKVYGCYEALERGMIIEGLSLLTGCPCVRLAWNATEPYMEEYLDTEERDYIELTWGRLLSMKESHFPMAACCGRSNVKEEDYDKVGLETRHAYSLLDVQQVGSQRLVKLRNPWGKSSWQGWQWQQEHEREEEGVFWIGAPDFFKYFSSVDVCKYHPTWHSVRVQGSIPSYATSTSKVVSFHVTDVTEMEFILYRPTYRGIEEARWHQNEVSMLIMEIPPLDTSTSSLSLPKSCVLTANYRSQGFSSITCSALFVPGHYAVLPLGFTHWHVKEPVNDLSYVLALFSAKGVVVDGHVTTQPGFMAESFFLLTYKLGTVVKKFDGLTVYQVDLKPACYMIVAENQDQDCHYTIISNIQPQNMVSTRDAVLTSDTLPPMHRQILHLLTSSYESERCSYSLSMQIKQSFTGEGSWRTHHDPPLDDTVAELHCPRFII